MANTPTSTLVIVTGPAGAGRTTAIHVFEDLGFETIDNLPISFFESLLAGDGGAGRPLAIWIDSRTRGFSARALADLIATLRRRGGLETHLLLLDCADDVLLRRYSETRRKHPLARDDAPEDGIAAEKSLMEPLRELADDVIDTTDLSPHDLKDALRQRFASDEETGLSVRIESFSYKRGVPSGLDMVFDCRFLRNPHWVEDLRPLDGRDAPVAEYVGRDDRYTRFLDNVTELLEFLLPAFRSEGKAYLSVGFGCTGGRHRSVAVSEAVAKLLEDAASGVSIRHRELERRRMSAGSVEKSRE